MSSDSLVTSPARRSVPWAVRPDVANSRPAASATTGTSALHPEGRRPCRFQRATSHLLGRPATSLVPPELRLGPRTGRSDGPAPEGEQVAQVQGAQEVGLHAPGGCAAVARRPGARGPAQPALVRPADGRPDGAGPAVDRRLLRR